MRHIRRYANRKLYDVADSRYVTLSDLGAMIRGTTSEAFEVIDKETGRDVTNLILVQIMEQMEREAPQFEVSALVGLIRSCRAPGAEHPTGPDCGSSARGPLGLPGDPAWPRTTTRPAGS
jgi:polyhydroxyalkanoate synthesis repressor PhaR